MRSFQDEEIIEGLRNSDSRVIDYIYHEYLPKWLSLTKKMGGGEVDARDAFQDALLGMFVRLRKVEPFDLRVTFKTYLFAICRKQWAYKKRGNAKISYTDEDWNLEKMEDNSLFQALEEAEKYRFFRKHLDALGGKCKAILQLHFQKKNNQEIGQALDLSEAYVKKRKFLCKQALKEAIQKDPNFHQY